MASDEPTQRASAAGAKEIKRTVWSGVLCGVGLVAFIDETVFHQLLHWHHFYDKSTQTVGLVSDGFFHAGGFICIVVGLFLRADAFRRRGFVPKRWWGALLIGAGTFQLYDGIVQHKIFGLHQIRYHVTIWPYDLTWNVLAAVMIIAGAVLMMGRAGARR
ncbi:MAG TPA: DUF2243 domain-containing protein [Jatrophihabitantaceae bacterium]